MMQRPTLIRIAEPCPESWAAMTPAGPGRHCAACRQVVVDFTQKTDAEILAILAGAVAGETCGRFGADQLERPLRPADTAGGSWHLWLGATLVVAGALAASRAAAQGSGYSSGNPAAMAASPTAPRPPAPTGAAEPPLAVPDGPALLRGIVMDAATGERLPGGTILLENTDQGTNTDMNGEFTFPLAADKAAAAVLRISSVGYEGTRLAAPEAMGAAPVIIRLKASTQLMGEVVITDYRQPYPWHPRRFFNWSKYWLSRPFRR